MSVQTTNHSSLFSGLFDSLRHVASRFGTILLVNRSMDARIARIEALNSKSDAELKALGLRREQIASYVFRDLFYS